MRKLRNLARHTEDTRYQVKHAGLERLSLRGIERLFGISRRTVLGWIEQWGNDLPLLETTLVDAKANRLKSFLNRGVTHLMPLIAGPTGAAFAPKESMINITRLCIISPTI